MTSIPDTDVRLPVRKARHERTTRSRGPSLLPPRLSNGVRSHGVHHVYTPSSPEPPPKGGAGSPVAPRSSSSNRTYQDGPSSL